MTEGHRCEGCHEWIRPFERPHLHTVVPTGLLEAEPLLSAAEKERLFRLLERIVQLLEMRTGIRR